MNKYLLRSYRSESKTDQQSSITEAAKSFTILITRNPKQDTRVSIETKNHKSIMKALYKTATIVALLGGLAVGAQADVTVFGNFEQASDGWQNWGNHLDLLDPSQPAGQYTFSSAVGVTLANYSLCVSNSAGGYMQTLALDLTADQRTAFMSHNLFSFDFSTAAATGGGWQQIYNVTINAPGLGWYGVPWNTGLWTETGATNWNFHSWNTPYMPNYDFWSGSPVRTQTDTLDYSSLLASITPNPGYIQIIFGLNGDGGNGGANDRFYFDNIIIPEPSSVALLGLGVLISRLVIKRRQA